MNKKIIFLSLLDWSEEIRIKEIIEAIDASLHGFLESLEVGTISANKKNRRYAKGFIRRLSETQEFDALEWYGGVSLKSDPSLGWDSYLFIDCSNSRELMLCANAEKCSIEKFENFLRKLSIKHNLGYGYASSEYMGSDIICHVFGITNGYPKNASEKAAAKKLSAWFREKLPMGGKPAQKRYLDGMFRGFYELNILNDSHIRALRESSANISDVSHIGSKSYLWYLSRDRINELYTECPNLII